jgi:CBS domain-containing protein
MVEFVRKHGGGEAADGTPCITSVVSMHEGCTAREALEHLVSNHLAGKGGGLGVVLGLAKGMASPPALTPPAPPTHVPPSLFRDRARRPGCCYHPLLPLYLSTCSCPTGLPIVDAEGAIVANFSVSDVRHLASVTNKADTEAALARPVLDFLRAHRGDAPLAPPVTVQVTDTVLVAIQLLAESHLHRVYIVDEDRKPVGVLSLTDVLRALVWVMDAEE